MGYSLPGVRRALHESQGMLKHGLNCKHLGDVHLGMRETGRGEGYVYVRSEGRGGGVKVGETSCTPGRPSAIQGTNNSEPDTNRFVMKWSVWSEAGRRRSCASWLLQPET